MQTPGWPVNLACAQAMKAATSSCGTWMNSKRSSARLERAEDAVDAVAGIAVDPVDAPLAEALQHEIADGRRHPASPPDAAAGRWVRRATVALCPTAGNAPRRGGFPRAAGPPAGSGRGHGQLAGRRQTARKVRVVPARRRAIEGRSDRREQNPSAGRRGRGRRPGPGERQQRRRGADRRHDHDALGTGRRPRRRHPRRLRARGRASRRQVRRVRRQGDRGRRPAEAGRRGPARPSACCRATAPTSSPARSGRTSRSRCCRRSRAPRRSTSARTPGPRSSPAAECNRHFFNTAFQNDAVHEATGKVVADAGIERVWLLAPNYPAGQDALRGFRRAYDPSGGEVVDEVYTQLGQLDYAAEIAAIQAAKPEAVYFFYPGGMGIAFLKQWAQAGVGDEVKLYASAFSVSQDILPAVGDAALGVENAAHWSPDLEAGINQRFVEDFSAKYGRIPSLFAAQGYDTALFIDAAAKAAGSTDDRRADRWPRAGLDRRHAGRAPAQHQPLPDPELLPARGGEERRRAAHQPDQGRGLREPRRRLRRRVPDVSVAGDDCQRCRARGAAVRAGTERGRSHGYPAGVDPAPDPGPERAAARRHAVPDGGRADAGVRRHGPDQPRPRLALHGGRLSDRDASRAGSTASCSACCSRCRRPR